MRVLAQQWVPAGLSPRRGQVLLPLQGGEADHLGSTGAGGSSHSGGGAHGVQAVALLSPELQPRPEDGEDHAFGVPYLVRWARNQDALAKDSSVFYGVSGNASKLADS